MNATTIIICLVELIIGIVVILLVKKYGTSQSAQKEEAIKEAALKEAALKEAELREKALREAQSLELERKNQELREAELREAENQRKMMEDMQRQLNDRDEALRRLLNERDESLRRETSATFQAMANEMLTRSTSSLRKENTEQIDLLLKPLREKIETFSRTMNEANVSQTASTKSLNDQIDRLLKLNLSIGEEARNLALALKGDSKTQGDWGEMVLETLLESAGMKEGINFRTQVTDNESGEKLRDEDGRVLRPDVVVLLPGEHKIVIDSKVSLVDYTRYYEAETEEDKKHFASRHVASVKRHVEELYAKNYQKLVKGSAEHVLMFMPVEGAYLSAIQTDPELWKYAYDRKVVIVSPTHIFSVMQIVAQMWRQDMQNKNAAEIAKQAAGMYDVFVSFTEDFAKVGKNLQNAVKSFEDCENRLSRSNRSLVAKAERMKKLGLKTKKMLGESLLAESEIDLDETDEVSEGIAELE